MVRHTPRVRVIKNAYREYRKKTLGKQAQQSHGEATSESALSADSESSHA
jgi:hypothetical protein